MRGGRSMSLYTEAETPKAGLLAPSISHTVFKPCFVV